MCKLSLSNLPHRRSGLDIKSTLINLFDLFGRFFNFFFSVFLFFSQRMITTLQTCILWPFHVLSGQALAVESVRDQGLPNYNMTWVEVKWYECIATSPKLSIQILCKKYIMLCKKFEVLHWIGRCNYWGVLCSWFNLATAKCISDPSVLSSILYNHWRLKIMDALAVNGPKNITPPFTHTKTLWC